MNILTTAQKSNEATSRRKPNVLASSMHMTYIQRGKTSIPALFGKYQCEYIAVLASSGLTIHFPEKSTTYLSFVYGSIAYIAFTNAVKAII